jgi:hypothetical protein
VDDFYAARTANMAALPWSTFAPPFSRDIARWISDRYAGEYLDVPSARARARDGLRQALREAPGCAVNVLANRFGVSARRVLQVKAELAREEEPPLLAAMRKASSE